MYKNLSGSVQDVIRTIETSKLRSLSEYLTKPGTKLDVNLANSILPALNDKLTNASYYAKALKRKLNRLAGDQKAYFMREMHGLKEEYSELLRSVITATASASNNPSISGDKQFAYFGKGSASSEDAKKVNASVYLDEISQRIQELINEL